MHRLFIFLILYSSLFLGNRVAALKRCNADDKAALLAIKAAFNNAYHFASWVPSDPCCEWYDVQCDPSTGRVVGLSIFQDANVTGPVPAALSRLPYLRTLMLHHLPGVSGPIPPAIASLSRLETLIISWTSVSGPVPSFLASLTALTLLDLSFNALTGAIPPSLSALPKLSFIDLSRNRLDGSLPPGLFRKSPQGAYLQLSHNNLSGGVPAEFGAIRFTQIDLSRNHFTGDASALFGRTKPAQQITLSRNSFEFDLSNVEFPEGLDSLDLSHNKIRGTIPNQIVNLGTLQFLNVSFNRLCGRIPTGGNMDRFDEYCFAHNKCLCGTPLPPCK